ncbi:hypothetical protein BJX61DRAFT_538835 [Aspergillus egyptiacus]|nr:hypothetical protein BJX61DRAFT_538835 [Aspergillus egyptiacus]
MSSLFEAYGLTKRLTPEDDLPPRLNPSREDAIEVALKEVNVTSLGPIQSQVVSLLEPVRELDWISGNPKELKTTEARTAALLYRRGESVSPCQRCERGGPWSACVVFPVYNKQSMWLYACANCLYYHRATGCSHRHSFEEQGGQPWDTGATSHTELDESAIVSREGLRYVLAEEGRKPVPRPLAVAQPVIPRKNKEHPEESKEQALSQPVLKHPRLSGARRTSRSAFDGETLPWPVPPSAWKDLAQLRSIVNDWKSFIRIAEARITRLEIKQEQMSSAEFWEKEAAKLFSNGSLGLVVEGSTANIVYET